MLKTELETIFYYLKTKRFALSKIVKFISPLDNEQSEEMQIIYGIYFNSFLSLIDYIEKDLNQKHIKDICYRIFGSPDNFLYVKELRNSIIHRGLDVSQAGCNIKGLEYLVVPFAPKIVYNRDYKKCYNTFVENLFQLVYLSEKINVHIYDICNTLKLLELIPMTNEIYQKQVLNDLYMPEYAKQMALNAKIDYNKMNIDLKRIHNDRIKKYFNTDDLFPKINKQE